MSRERRIQEYFTPDVIWQNKNLKQMTDQDCIECLSFIQRRTGTYYVDPMYTYMGNH